MLESFKDIDRLSQMCKYSNCTHTNEPGCRILEALENGELQKERFKKISKINKHNTK